MNCNPLQYYNNFIIVAFCTAYAAKLWLLRIKAFRLLNLHSCRCVRYLFSFPSKYFFVGMCKVSEFPHRLALMKGIVLDFSNYAGLFLYIVLSNVWPCLCLGDDANCTWSLLGAHADYCEWNGNLPLKVLLILVVILWD
jgi:hypothetical protein